MRYDLVIRGGTVVDGTGGPARRADVGIVGDRIVEVGDCAGEAAETYDASGQAGHARLRRHPHPPRRPAGLGPGGHRVVLARRHHRGDGQLRGHVRAVQAGRPPAAGRDDGVGRGHPRRRHPDRPAVGLGELPEYLDSYARMPKGINVGGMVGHCSVRIAAMGDRAIDQHHADADDIVAMCALVEEAMRGRRPRLLDVPHLPPPDARRPGGARHLGRARGAARHRRGHGTARQGRLRVRGRQRPPAPRAGRRRRTARSWSARSPG